MKTITLCILISFPIVFFAQNYTPFLKDGVYWEEFGAGQTQFCEYEWGIKYFLGEDTLIQNRTYTQLKYTSILGAPNSPFCPPYTSDTLLAYNSGYFLREDVVEKKVYYFEKNHFRDSLLYDFSMEVGDTLASGLKVTGISVMTFADGTSRKVIEFASQGPGFYIEGGGFWIESIGNKYSLFSKISGPCICPYSICHGNESQSLYGNVCSTQTSSSTSLFLETLSLSPNPVSNYLKVSTPVSKEITSVVIFDLLGRSYSVILKDSQINVSHILSGVYFLQMSGNGFKWVEKIMKM